jgi:hypothetical protein
MQTMVLTDRLAGRGGVSRLPKDTARAAGQAFEALFLDKLNAYDRRDGRRILGQLGADLRRRPEVHSLKRIGAVLATLAYEEPTALLALLAELESWALAQCTTDTQELIDAAAYEATADAEAETAMLRVFAAARSRSTIETAVREVSEAVAAQKALLLSLYREHARTPMPGRVVRRHVAAGVTR